MPSQTFATAVPELRRATPRAVQAAATGIAPKVQPFFMESQSRRMRKRGCRINPSFLHRNCIIHRAILLSLCKTDKASKYGYFDKNLPDAASEHADRICARHSRQDFVGEPPCGYPRSAGRRQIDPRIAAHQAARRCGGHALRVGRRPLFLDAYARGAGRTVLSGGWQGALYRRDTQI